MMQADAQRYLLHNGPQSFSFFAASRPRLRQSPILAKFSFVRSHSYFIYSFRIQDENYHSVLYKGFWTDAV